MFSPRVKKLSAYAVCIALVLIAIVGCSPPSSVPAGGLGAFTRQLDERVPKWLEQYDVPGAAIALVHGGQMVWSNGYGAANLAQGVPVTSDTVFQAASISKAVTAWGVMRLVEKGRLDLDTPAEQYLSRWHLPASHYSARGVTIRRLLSHTAGLSLHNPEAFPLGARLPLLEEALSGGSGAGGAVSIAMEPGTEYSYSGANYSLLQLVIEEVSGESFAAYMQHEVLRPLGMTHSSFEWGTELSRLMAEGYDASGKPDPRVVFTEKAAAGLYTTAPDLARFVAAGMVGANGEPAGRGIVTPNGVSEIYTRAAQMRALQAFSSEAVGLGHSIETLPDKSKAVGHSGTNWGWQVVFMSIPGRGDGIVVLTNGTHGIELYADVLDAWGTWLGTGAPKVTRLYQGLRVAVVTMAGLLIIGLALSIRQVARQIRAGYRRWLWQIPGRPALRSYVGFGASIMILALVASLWWLIAHQILEWLVSKRAYWLTLVVLCWCLYGVMVAFLRPVGTEERPVSH